MKKSLLSLLALALAFVTVAGCQHPATVTKDKDKKVAPKDEHDHGTLPHGGTIIEFDGTKWHGEITFDHKKHEATFYVLDESAKKASPIAAEKVTLTIKSPQSANEMKADPEKDDPKGKSSRFVAKHEHFSKEQEFEGEVIMVIDGKQYIGQFKEEDEHHKHEKK